MLYKLELSQNNYITILGRTNENPPWRHDGRKVSYNHLILIVSGSCACRIEDRLFKALPGDLLFIPADKFYKLTTVDHCEYCFACFYAGYKTADKRELSACLATLPGMEKKFYLCKPDAKQICLSDHVTLTESEAARMLALFTKCQTLGMSGKYLDRLMIDAHFDELLISACEAACRGGTQRPTSLSLDRMTGYIVEHFNEKVTPDSLSKVFGLSKEHICNLFKSGLGMTVSEYVNMVKLDRALELLSNSSMNISQIAEYLGYSSVYYFSKVFKSRFGVSPSRCKV